MTMGYAMVCHFIDAITTTYDPRPALSWVRRSVDKSKIRQARSLLVPNLCIDLSRNFYLILQLNIGASWLHP